MYSCFNSIAAWISTAPLDLPKNRYSLGLRASRLRLSVRTEVSSCNMSSGAVTLSVVARIAEVSVSIEWVGGGCCGATSGLGLKGTRSLSSESWSSLKRMGSGTSYGLILTRKIQVNGRDVLSVAASPIFLHDSLGFQHSFIGTSSQLPVVAIYIQYTHPFGGPRFYGK